MLRRHDGELLGGQPHEIAHGEEAHQVHEPFQERLVERRTILLAHDRLDAVGGEALAVRPVAPERVEHVGDADDHGAEIQLSAADALRISAEVLLEVMLERDDRRERRHLRRPSQDVRAVHNVALHEVEFFLVQLIGLVQHIERRVDLADVVHERREAELAQQRPFDIQRAGLGHRQRRHVDHVRESVVVVFLERRQGHQRRAVLRDELGEALDDFPGGARVGLIPGLCRVPKAFRGFDRGSVHAPRRRDPRLIVGGLIDRDFSHRDMTNAARDELFAERHGRVPVAERGHEAAHFLARQPL